MPNEKKSTMKRKRNPVEDQEDDLSRKMTGKLHHCLKDVRKAAKKAKTFETQKLVKKLKGLRSKTPHSEEIAGLEEELAILKRTDHEPFANTALKTKIKKDKMLSHDSHMDAAVASELASNLIEPTTPGSHEAKVHGRLLSSKVLASEVASVIEMLKSTLQPEPKKAQEVEDEHEENAAPPPSKKSKIVEDANSDDESSEAEGSEPRQTALSEDEEVGDDGWESGSVHSGNEAGGEDSEGDSEDEDETETEDEDEDEDGEDQKPAKASTSKQAVTKPVPSKSKTTAESTFLPSLAVGFTRGDSDASDWSDAEPDVPEKKNRRGQRARRAIWEKKFGKNANHVKKQQEIYGKDSRGKRMPPSDRGYNNNARPHDDARSHATPAGAASRPMAQPPTRPPATNRRQTQVEDKPLHPSWEAKRKMKEKQNPSIVPAQGKKIVF